MTVKASRKSVLKGTVNIETGTERHQEMAKWVEELSAKLGFPMKSKNVIICKIDKIYGVAPGPCAGSQLS